MQTANSKQIGGNHYKGNYQHWDFVLDTNQSYLQGCATKYISRWRKKNGLEDLKKAQHYIDKLKEQPIQNRKELPLDSLLARFAQENNIGEDEDLIIYHILRHNYNIASVNLEHLIKVEEAKQSAKVDNTGQENPFGFDVKEEM